MQVQVAPDDIATRRDKASAAFLFLSGARATAFCTLTLECVNIITDSIYAVLSDGDMQQKIARLGQGTRGERIKAIVSEVLERLEGE